MRPGVTVIALMVCASAASVVRAQTAPVPEGWVVLPVDEYRALRERAFPAPAPPAPPPVDATLTRVDYDLRTDGDTVVGRATLAIDVLRDGWTRVQIPAGLIVRNASVDGRRVSLVDGTPPHVLMSRAGRAVLVLDIVIPLTASGGAESIALPPSASPIVRTRLTLPRNGVNLAPSGGFVAEHDEAAAESRWTVFGRPNVPLTLTWKRKVDDRRAELPLRVRARVTELVGLGEESSQVSASIRVEVLQGLARDLAVQIPAGLVVNQVTGPTVGDWDAEGGTLHVRLLEPTMSEASFVVQGEIRSAREGSIAIPIVRVPAAERETGGVAVDIAGAGEIGAQMVRGLDRADPSDLGEPIATRETPSMIAFRHRPVAGLDVRSLTVDVVRYTPQAVVVANVEEARYRALASEDGRVLVEARYAVRNNQRSFLKAVLPANATLWSVEVAGRPIQPGLAGDGSILLPLEKGRAGEQAPTFVVELVYFQRADAWSETSRPRVDLPALDLPVSRTGVELRYSPRFHVDAQPGAFRVDRDPGPTADALRAPRTAMTGASGGVAGGAAAKSSDSLQRLVDRFRTESGGRTAAGLLPIHVEFPEFGSSMFLASELTAETRALSVELTVKRISH